jgi:ketosteroid isomerase-like protein
MTIRNSLRFVAVLAILHVGGTAAADKTVTGQALADKYAACWQLFNQAQWEEFSKCYAPGTVSTAPGLPPARGAAAIVDKHARPADFKGKAAEREHLEGFWKMSSNVKCTTPVLFAAGDYTVAIGKFTGKNDGDVPAMGLKKTGKTFAVDYIEFIRWQDGKAVEMWPFMDGAQLAEQLGLIPAPGKVQARN